MVSYIEPLDFKTIFLGYFLGSAELFAFAFIIVYSYVSARMGLSNLLYLSLLAVGGVLFAIYMGQSIYVLIIFVIGLVTFRAFSRIIT